MGILLGVFGFFVLLDVTQLVVDAWGDHKMPKTQGYRYSDIPSDVNSLEIWAILLVGVGFQLSVKGLFCIFIAQAIICCHSLYIIGKRRRPYWYDWI